jgi:hypothetical protein
LIKGELRIKSIPEGPEKAAFDAVEKALTPAQYDAQNPAAPRRLVGQGWQLRC